MKLERLFDEFENYDIEYQELNEADGGISDLGEVPKGVLGVFKVKHAFGAGVPFGISRNKRVYTKKVWETALNEESFKEAFENRMVVGMLSHPEKDLSYDDMLREELASHVLVDVKYKEIQKDSGIYEATFYILDTKAGRTLKAILAAGAKPAVSTRAYGTLKNEKIEYEGKKLPVINEKNFKLVTLDVVAVPGLKNARFSEIKLTEELKKDIQYLEEKSKEYGCDFGLCSIFKEEKKEDRLIEKLSKEDLLKLLKDLANENKKLLEKVDSKDDKLVKKARKLFINYLEMLSKLLKFNVKYEDEFREIIEILDKDDMLTQSEIKTVQNIISKLQKDEMLDESIKIVIEKIQNIIGNKYLKKVTKEQLFELLDEFVEAGGVLFYYFFNKEQEKEKELNELKEKLNIAKNALIEASKNSSELKKELEEKEEEINIKKMIIENLGNEINGLMSDLEDIKESYTKEINEIKKEFEQKEKEFKEKENKFTEEIETLESLINEHEKANIDLVDELKELAKENQDLNEKLNKVNEELNKYQLKYLIHKYSLTESEAKELLENGIKFAEEKAKTKMKRMETKQFDIKEEKGEPLLVNRLI